MSKRKDRQRAKRGLVFRGGKLVPKEEKVSGDETRREAVGEMVRVIDKANKEISKRVRYV